MSLRRFSAKLRPRLRLTLLRGEQAIPSASIALGLVLIVFVLLSVKIGRFVRTDEIAFKAAGRNWASTGHFAAPELWNFGGFRPPVQTVWFAQMPLYTASFGLFVRLFGGGSGQSIAWDALIHASLVVLTYVLVRRSAPVKSPWAAFLAALLVVTVMNPGRADELAACLAMAALSVYTTTEHVSYKQMAAAGVLLGLSAGTSIVCPLLFIPELILMSVRRRDSPRHVLLSLVPAATLAVIVIVSPILIYHPDALGQFTQHASHQLGQAYAGGVAFSWRNGKRFLLIAALAPVLFLVGGRREFSGSLASLLFIAIVLPAKYYYVWMVGPLIIARAAILYSRVARRWLWILVAALSLGAVQYGVRDVLIMALMPTDQGLELNIDRLRRTIPAGSVVAASDFWPGLADSNQYRSLVHAAHPIDDADWVVLIASGSGVPGRPQILRDGDLARSLAADFETVYSDLPTKVPTFMGLPLSNSAWGWGPRVFKRVRRTRRHPLADR
jgi:hypothetical protein